MRWVARVFVIALLVASLRGQERHAKADAVVEAYLKATGGAAAIEAIQDSTTTSDLEVDSPQGTLSVKSKVFAKGSRKRRAEQTIGATEVILGYNGITGWLSQGGVVLDAPKSIVDLLKAEMDREDLPLRYKEEGMKVEYLGSQEFEGRPAEGVRFTDRHGNVTSAYFDRSSHLQVRSEYAAPNMFGAGTSSYVNAMGDHRKVSEVMIPFRVTQYVDGRKMVDETVLDIKVNAGLPDSLFEKPHPSGE